MNKTETLRALRIECRDGFYIVCVGDGLTFRAFSGSVSEKAAKTSRAAIRRDPSAYGIA